MAETRKHEVNCLKSQAYGTGCSCGAETRGSEPSATCDFNSGCHCDDPNCPYPTREAQVSKFCICRKKGGKKICPIHRTDLGKPAPMTAAGEPSRGAPDAAQFIEDWVEKSNTASVRPVGWRPSG